MDNSCEPMDVDLSTNSANNSFKEQTPSPSLRQDSVATYIENGNSKSEVRIFNIVRNKTMTEKSNSKFIILGLFIVLFSASVYYLTDLKCHSLDLMELKSKLNMRLYGQTEVRDDLIKALAEDVDSKILFLYGGTGVGKTYTISLALENFWNSSNIYHYTMPSFLNTYSTETMLSINICEFTMLVVDDLKENDLRVKDQIIQVIKKSETLNKKLTVILIYNCDIIKNEVKKCDDSFHSKLAKAFEDVKVYKTFIEFKPLNQEVLKMCVKDELEGKRLNDQEFDSILSNFNVTLDGCKGVYKKMKFLNMMRRY